MRNPPQFPRINFNRSNGYSGLAWVPTLMLVALACAALLVVIPAEAAPARAAATTTAAADSAAIEARYQQERAACMNGQSNQDRTTCLKEAGAAHAEAKRGALNVPGTASSELAANASQRCKGLPAEDAKACTARMRGEGSTSGTAAQGGILRELVTVQPTTSAASAALK